MRLPTGCSPPVISIVNGTFHRHYPSAISRASNPALFRDLSFELPSKSAGNGSGARNWCVIGPSLSGKTAFLQILRGQHLCFPPQARSFPYLSTDAVPHRLRTPQRAVLFVGFDASSSGGVEGIGPAMSAYLSARYESRREAADFLLKDFLLSNRSVNPSMIDEKNGQNGIASSLLERVLVDLRLETMFKRPVSFLSNGQRRRAHIARALLAEPEVLLLDEPFMGLDPPTVLGLSLVLGSLTEKAAPRLVLSARPQDPIPDWVTHLVYLRTDSQVAAIGDKTSVLNGLRHYVKSVWEGGLTEDVTLPVRALRDMGRTLVSGEGITGRGFAQTIRYKSQKTAVNPGPTEHATAPRPQPQPSRTRCGELVVEMQGCRVRYGDRIALGNWTETRNGQHTQGLHWKVRRGERWGVFGPNGSGKTTIVSLLCSDHPQTYSLPIRLFGRSRLPGHGGELPLTFWDIQARIGHSSPEIHQHMPRELTVRQVLESAWADTFRARPKMDGRAKEQVETTLWWFERELNPGFKLMDTTSTVSQDRPPWADNHIFGELSFSAQRILLLLRATVKQPDVVVLDEAFSGMDDAIRDKCMHFLNEGRECKDGVVAGGLKDRQALICISHVREEVPDCVREWMCLPDPDSGAAARFGKLDGPLGRDARRWDEIWGIRQGSKS